MTKKELIAEIAKSSNSKVADVTTIVDATLDEIRKQVNGGNEVVLRNFGVFKQITRKQRVAQDIKAGKPIVVPEHVTPVFRISKAF